MSSATGSHWVKNKYDIGYIDIYNMFFIIITAFIYNNVYLLFGEGTGNPLWDLGGGMEVRLPLEMSPGREAACRAVFGTWGFFRTMHGKTAPSC